MRTLKTWRTRERGDKAVAIGRHSSRLRAAGATGSASDLELLDDDPVRERVMDELVEQHPLANAMVRNRKAELGGFAGREAKRVLVELTDAEVDLYDDIATYLREEYSSISEERRVGREGVSTCRSRLSAED